MKIAFASILFLLTSCFRNQIKTGDSLDKSTVDLIKSMGLLDDDEKVIRYYSNFEEDNAGSFYTEKKIAHYWIDEHYKDRTDTSFALYQDIIRIDTVYRAGLTYAPFLKAYLKDSSQITLYADGDHQDIKSFFEDVINRWNAKVK